MSCALIVIILAQPFDARELGARFGYPESTSCASCHPRHYQEWRGSLHAATRRRFRAPRDAAHRSPDRGSVDLGDPSCARCHGGNLSEVLGHRAVAREPSISHAAESNIACTLCHQFRDALPDARSGARYDTRDGGGPFHEDLEPIGALRDPDFCGPCHDVTAPNGVRIERTYEQYRSSPYPHRGEVCTTCHMITYGGAMVPGGRQHGALHRHDVLGVDVAFNAVPGIDSQRVRVVEFLNSAAALFVRVPDEAVAGDTLSIPIDVVNSGAGHNFPAGPAGERRLWLEVDVEVVDRTGATRRRLTSGREHRDGRPVASSLRGDFTDRLVDAEGREVASWHEAARVDERSLRPLESRRVEFALRVPHDVIGGAVRVAARLRFQACSPHKLRALGLESLLDAYPIIDVQRFGSGPVPIVERPAELEGAIVVPDDIATIPEAIAGAPDGAMVLVRPGVHRLARGLRFGGKAITLRSLEGPERTRIELSEGVRDAVLVFDGGERAGTRVEGFTLSGGVGVEGRDGETRGGGVYCVGASPTLTGNRIAGNSASGDGGGVFLERASATLVDNVILKNVAGGSGGGIAIAGEGAPEIRGGEVFANRAARAGGGLSAGSAAAIGVAHCAVRGNQALRGGGIAVVSAKDEAGSVAGSFELESSEIAGNAAPLGGGLYLDASIDVRVRRTLVAGNTARLGGALMARGGVRVSLESATITENKASRYGAFRLVLTEGAGMLRARNSIVWANEPTDLQAAEIARDFAYCLVDEDVLESGGGGDTNRGGLPLFERFPGRREPCASVDEPGCVPVRWSRGASPRAVSYARWVPARYGVIKDSPCVDAGDPRDPPDPDGTRRDIGAVTRTQARRGFVRGDVDGNGLIEMLDVARLLELLFTDAPASSLAPCVAAGDVDDVKGVGLLDALALLMHFYGYAIAPAEPFPECGLDPTPGDGLPCFQSHGRCR